MRFPGCCELLSNFLYFCSRNNTILSTPCPISVVNCSQIFCTFAVETTVISKIDGSTLLWIALKFFVLLQSKQQFLKNILIGLCCELLSNFLYFCSRNNFWWFYYSCCYVVNCSQIFCTFAVETTLYKFGFADIMLWIALKFFVLLQSKQLNIYVRITLGSCELLSNFLYFCSRNNALIFFKSRDLVVNCSQIFCTFAVETTRRVWLLH